MKNVYGLYKKSRNAAWQVLIDCSINSLPINITKIAKYFGVAIHKNSLAEELGKDESGICLIQDGKWHIIYDDTMSKQRARYTIAHELGHIVLGHPLRKGYRYHARTFEVKSDTEWQAERFAASLLAPSCVLWGLNIHSAEDIQRLCNISYQSAKIRAERMQVLYDRNKFLISPLERQVFENFKDFIKNIKK